MDHEGVSGEKKMIRSFSLWWLPLMARHYANNYVLLIVKANDTLVHKTLNLCNLLVYPSGHFFQARSFEQ